MLYHKINFVFQTDIDTRIKIIFLSGSNPVEAQLESLCPQRTLHVNIVCHVLLKKKLNRGLALKPESSWTKQFITAHQASLYR